MSISAPTNSNKPKYIIPAHRSPQQNAAKSTAKPDSQLDRDAFVPQGKSGLILAKGNVSPSHIRKADWIILALPKGLQKHFRDQGCQVKLAQTMGEIFPDMSGSPDGADPAKKKKRSWEETKGRAVHTVIGIPELIKYPDQDSLSPQTQPIRGLNVLRHELGHVLHNTSPLLYDTDGSNDDFYNAYTDDLEQLSPADRERFRYGIQTDDIEHPTGEGMKETFAEVFASLYGGGTIETTAIQKAFPRTTAYMKQAVQSLITAPEDSSKSIH